MMIKSESLGDEAKLHLYSQLKRIVKNDLKEKILLLEMYLGIPKEDTSYEDLNNRLIAALKSWPNHQTSPSPTELLLQLSVTEQFIKSIIFTVDLNNYKKHIENSSSGFKNAIQLIRDGEINLNKNLDLNFSKKDQSIYGNVYRKFINTDDLNWYNAYSHRNKSAHISEFINIQIAYERIYSILYVILESLWKYKIQIEALYFNNLIFSLKSKHDYFDSIVRKYENENLQSTFVEVSITEDLRGTKREGSIDINEKSNFWEDLSEDTESKFKYFHHTLTSTSSPNYIKIKGQAGLGKSRLMKHMEYLDAVDKKRLPIYVELKSIKTPNTSLLEIIANEAAMSVESCNLLMETEGINLYLDGVNEIMTDDSNKKIICSNIDLLHKQFPNCKIIVSDREGSSITTKRDVPTYIIDSLSPNLIEIFISKNTTRSYSEEIKIILNENKNLYKVINTPFILITFISLVESDKFNSNLNNKMVLVKTFINELIYRESTLKNEIRADKIKQILPFLFLKEDFSTIEKEYFTRNQITKKFNDAKTYFGFELDTVEVLELITQMGILENNTQHDTYRFSNEHYKEHFQNEAILLKEDLY